MREQRQAQQLRALAQAETPADIAGYQAASNASLSGRHFPLEPYRTIEEWLNGSVKSPKEAIEKRRLKELLGD